MEDLIEKLKNEIEFLSDCEKFSPINGGGSGASLFLVLKQGLPFVVKTINRAVDIKRRNVVNYKILGLKVPNVYECGTTDSFGFYVIMDYIPGGTLKQKAKSVSPQKVYDFAVNIGLEQKTLSEEFSTAVDEEVFFDEFQRIEFNDFFETVELLSRNKQQIANFNLLNFKQIEKDFFSLMQEFKTEPIFYMHNDLKLENIMLSGDDYLLIDYENSQPFYLTNSFRGGAGELFVGSSAEKKAMAMLISGVVSAMLGGKEPQNLNKKLAYCFLKNTFVYELKKALNDENFKEANAVANKLIRVYGRKSPLSEQIDCKLFKRDFEESSRVNE